MKRITVLGATGSVGLRTLELVSSFPEEFAVAGLAARGSNIDLIADLCRKYGPKAVALLDERAVDRLAAVLPTPRPELLRGPAGLVALAAHADADIVVSALVGAAGLLPTMAAIQAGRTLALANLSDLDPPRALYYALFSHPTVPERIAFGRRWAEEHRAPA